MNIKILLNFPRLFFVKIIIKLNRMGEVYYDVNFWCSIKKIEGKANYKLYVLLLNYKEFRNLVVERFLLKDKKIFAHMIKFMFPNEKSLIFGTPIIGKGLFIQHGFSSVICAKSIGENCWINQQVTIGYEQNRQPTIGNNVRICAGAIIIGDVTVGDNSIIAAGAVVVKDIPCNEVWGGNPAKYIKKVKGSSFSDQR